MGTGLLGGDFIKQVEQQHSGPWPTAVLVVLLYAHCGKFMRTATNPNTIIAVEECNALPGSSIRS